MRLWLAISGALFMAWAAGLLLSPLTLLSAEQVAEHAVLISWVAVAQVVLAVLAGWSATNPRSRRAGIYTTIAALLVKWVVDTYGVLVALPPQQAALTLADLILSVALLVGTLEALPRIVGAEAEKVG